MRGKWLATMVIGATVATTAVTPSATAQAPEPWPIQRRGDGFTYYQKRQTKGLEHGYEGYVGPPGRESFCSYRRTPERQCGPKGCRVTGWALEQWCQ